MRKINRQYHGKRIYRLRFQYMKQLESTKDPWFSQYRQWDLDWIRATGPDIGSISKGGFDIWWDEHWKNLFGGGNKYTGEVQEIVEDDDFTDQNYIYLKIEIPLKERDYRGSKIVSYNKMVQDDVKTILKNKKRRPPYRFPISAGRVDFEKVEQRLELYIWKTKLDETRTSSVSLKKETEILTAHISYLSGDIDENSKRVKIRRDTEKLNKTLENISVRERETEGTTLSHDRSKGT